MIRVIRETKLEEKMPNTIRFIDTVIRNIKPTDKREIFWCIGCPGFGLRVNPSGLKEVRDTTNFPGN